MKKIVCFLFAAFAIATATAQSAQYTEKMKQAIAMMDSAKTTEAMQDASALFERIGDAEKTQWLPFYYAAFIQTNIGWKDASIDKDKLAAKTKALIDKAEAIEKNSELYVLRNMVATQQMMVDPQNRWQTYGTEAAKALSLAKKSDPGNPRIAFLEGQSKFNTPEAFGGGKAAAKPFFQKSVEQFGTFKPSSELHPNWGKKQAEEMLAACQ